MDLNTSDKHKGYFDYSNTRLGYPFGKPEKLKGTLVKYYGFCKNCNYQWFDHEKEVFGPINNDTRIKYDYCDKCKDTYLNKS